MSNNFSSSNSNNNDLSTRLNQILSSSDSFSVPSYLNTALSLENILPDQQTNTSYNESEIDTIVQTKMSELALQLQLETQSCHDEIERIGMEMNAIFPRCEADVIRLSVGLEGMKSDVMSLVTNDSGQGGEDNEEKVIDEEDEEENETKVTKKATQSPSNIPPLETLSTLHALRTNLSLTKSILDAASSWDATISLIPTLLSPQPVSTSEDNDDDSSAVSGVNNHTTAVANLSEAVSALSTLQHGSRALRGMPGRNEREDIISSFQSKIEILLKPRLLHALQTASGGATNTGGGNAGAGRLGPLITCANMYQQLNKLDTLKEEYVKARPAAVHKAWFGFNPPSVSSGDGGVSFVDWLPGWYEMILMLLADERRRSATVFGNEMGPQITAQVMGACFRPLLSSFTSRLSSIFPLRPASTLPSSSSSNNTRLEGICLAYESTLRFLSQAYDHMVGCDNTIIYNEFANIASPFAPYQLEFSTLELRHSSENAALIAKNIQKAGRGKTTNDVAGGALDDGDLDGVGGTPLDILQNAVDQLTKLSIYIFPIAEGSLARYELLNSGYQITKAIQTMDTLISNHISELSISINTLSATLASSNDTANDNNSSTPNVTLEEEYVQCALEMLKMAGSFTRALRSFETLTRDRLKNLCTGMRAGLTQMEGGNTPDSLSIVEVRGLLSRYVCNNHQEEEVTTTNKTTTPSQSSKRKGGNVKLSQFVQLQRYAGDTTNNRSLGNSGGSIVPSTSSPIQLFTKSIDVMSKLASTCQTFVFDVCYAIPRNCFASMSSLSIWREEEPSGLLSAFDSMVHSNANATNYSTLPQQYITQVGEHILALVQALEPFASNEHALELANEVMDGVGDVAIPFWKEFVTSTGSIVENDENGVIASLMDGKDLKHVVTHHDFHEEEEEEEEEEDDDHEEIDESERKSAAFCNQWLDVIGSAVTGRLLERILRIPRLSKKGGGKLLADLNYLVNVFSALGITGHPHPLLNHFGSLMNMDGNDIREKIEEDYDGDGVGDEGGAEVGKVVRAAEGRIATMKMMALR